MNFIKTAQLLAFDQWLLNRLSADGHAVDDRLVSAIPQDVGHGLTGQIALGSSLASGGSVGCPRPGWRMAPSITKWATWIPLGASSRAMLWASPRRVNLPIAKGAEPG